MNEARRFCSKDLLEEQMGRFRPEISDATSTQPHESSRVAMSYSGEKRLVAVKPCAERNCTWSCAKAIVTWEIVASGRTVTRKPKELILTGESGSCLGDEQVPQIEV